MSAFFCGPVAKKSPINPPSTASEHIVLDPPANHEDGGAGSGEDTAEDVDGSEGEIGKQTLTKHGHKRVVQQMDEVDVAVGIDKKRVKPMQPWLLKTPPYPLWL